MIDSNESALQHVINDQWFRIRVLICTVGVLILCHHITEPYLWNGAIHSHFARNHLYYGLDYTQGYCTWGETRDPPATPQRYLNHPPLLSLMLAVPMAIFGDAEWVGRTIPIAATVGSVWLLMTIVGRIYSPTHGMLAGVFYLLLPITSYFGRMIDHTAPAQFFSLLMLFAYLRWTEPNCHPTHRKIGIAIYAVAAILGIGTGWGTLLMPPLILADHLVRNRKKQSRTSTTLWIIVWPTLALIAVVLHIAAGTNWDIRFFTDLLFTRTISSTASESIGWVDWLSRQITFFGENFTFFAAATILVFCATSRSRRLLSPSIAPSGPGVPTIIALHGLLYILVFRNQSFKHDYWQFFLAPYVALTWAFVVIAVFGLLRNRNKFARWGACTLLVAAPLPSFRAATNAFFSKTQLPNQYIETFKTLKKLVPDRAPVLTSHDWPVFEESFGGYVNRWRLPQVAFYANRPLLYEIDLDAIMANQKGAPAYILEMTGDEQSFELARYMLNHYETVTVGRHHLIALLNRPKP